MEEPDTSRKKVDPAKLRNIEQIFESPPLRPDLMRFVDWVARYTLSARGML